MPTYLTRTESYWTRWVIHPTIPKGAANDLVMHGHPFELHKPLGSSPLITMATPFIVLPAVRWTSSHIIVFTCQQVSRLYDRHWQKASSVDETLSLESSERNYLRGPKFSKFTYLSTTKLIYIVRGLTTNSRVHLTWIADPLLNSWTLSRSAALLWALTAPHKFSAIGYLKIMQDVLCKFQNWRWCKVVRLQSEGFLML